MAGLRIGFAFWNVLLKRLRVLDNCTFWKCNLSVPEQWGVKTLIS